MKKALYVLTLTLIFNLTGLIAARGESLQQAAISSALEPTSTCWLTCFSLNPGGVTSYKTFHVTQQACCSGAALSCPPGSVPSHPSWGEPAKLCPLPDGGP